MPILRSLTAAPALVAAIVLIAAQDTAHAQDPDLFDDTVLRQIDLTVYDANGMVDPAFYSRLEFNWLTQQHLNFPADLTISGPDLPAPVTRTGVGIRIKGQSSFSFLPPGSQKASFNIEIDDQDPDADLWGYSTLNLNNGFEDPTFSREIAFFRFIRPYTPAGLGNHVVLTINGEPWGVYANIQQYNKRLLEEYYQDGGGVRIKGGSGTGSALRWLGSAISKYFDDYELSNDGDLGTSAAWQTLVDACDALNNSPSSEPELIDDKFSVDGAIWAVVAENLFMDEDSYIVKGNDFSVYWDPVNARSIMHQRDGNETWGVSSLGWPGGVTATLSPMYRFDAGSRPVLSKLMAVPRWRERYFAHMRTMLEDFSWDELEAQLLGYSALIDTAVQDDPKRLYSYSDFQLNFLTDVTIDVIGQPVTAPGLRRFVDDRRAYLLAHPEIDEPAPTILWANHAPYRPQPGEPVVVRMRSLPGAGAAIDGATLYYRHQPGRYFEEPMADDGRGPDAVAGDGVYCALLPAALAAGESVEYYVSARSEVAVGGGMTFLPKFAEGRPLSVRVGFGPVGMRVTEVMYSASDGEFFELTNLTGSPVDLTGWSMDDSSAEAGTFDLTAGGVVEPGESIVVTDVDAAAFATAWGLGGAAVLGDNADAKLGRNDTIHIYDAMGALHERFSYGDERFLYSVRSKDESAWVCDSGVGRDDPYSWRSSVLLDAQGSVESLSGDIGSPGVFTGAACSGLLFGEVYCTSNPNSTGKVAELTAVGSPVAAANQFMLLATNLPPRQFGFFVCGRAQGNMPLVGGGQGVLCLDGTIGRVRDTVGMSTTGGEFQAQLDLFGLPEGPVPVAVMAGQTWSFQLWFRDVNPMQTSNFTEAIEVSFE